MLEGLKQVIVRGTR